MGSVLRVLHEGGLALDRQLTDQRHKADDEGADQDQHEHAAQDPMTVAASRGAPPATHRWDTDDREGDAQRDGIEKDPAEAKEEEQVDQDDRPDHEDQSMESLPVSHQPAMRTSKRGHREREQEQHREG